MGSNVAMPLTVVAALYVSASLRAHHCRQLSNALATVQESTSRAASAQCRLRRIAVALVINRGEGLAGDSIRGEPHGRRRSLRLLAAAGSSRPSRVRALLYPIWIDDDEVWLSTAEMTGSNYASAQSGLLRVNCSSPRPGRSF